MRNKRRSSSALSSDGFDFDDDTEMESENQDAEDDVLDDEVCVKHMTIRLAMGLTPGQAV